MIKRVSQSLFRNFKVASNLRQIQYTPTNYFSKIKINDETSDDDFKPKTKETISNENVHQKIQEWVDENQIVLFMKGNPQMPMCGYSNFVVEILKFYKIRDYKSIDILADDTIRSEVKVFSEWPTYPQLYINGEFIGGSDIVSEMHKDGSLKELLEQAGLVK